MKPKRLKANAFQDKFGVTFGVSFALTMVAFPFMVAGAEREQVSGGIFVAMVLGAMAIAVPMFAKSIIIAAFVFYPAYHFSALLVSRRLAFVVAAVAAAYLSATVALAVNVDVIPPDLSFNDQLWRDAPILGVLAASIAAFVATMQMIASDQNE